MCVNERKRLVKYVHNIGKIRWSWEKYRISNRETEFNERGEYIEDWNENREDVVHRMTGPV